MARSARQNKILEIISVKEIETQYDLAKELKGLGFEVTQATVSRDIKELGLIKILSAESGKYKYALVQTDVATSNKFAYIFRDAVVSTRTLKNFVIVRTLKGMAGAVCSAVGKLGVENILGVVNGEDTVLMIFENNLCAEVALTKLNGIFGM